MPSGNPSTRNTTVKRPYMRRHKFTLGSLVIAAGLVYLFVAGVDQSTATHMTLQTLLGKSLDEDQRIQLGGGTVVPGSIEWDTYHSRPEFTITDGEHTLKVRYVGNAVLPDTFKDKALVVLEGQYHQTDQTFSAEVVFAKCPSKYEGQSYEGHVQALNSGSS